MLNQNHGVISLRYCGFDQQNSGIYSIKMSHGWVCSMILAGGPAPDICDTWGANMILVSRCFTNRFPIQNHSDRSTYLQQIMGQPRVDDEPDQQ